jgi:carboxypeptidase family protein
VKSVEESRWCSIVTFAVDEAFAGLDANTRTVKVRDCEHRHSIGQARFVASLPDINGNVQIGACFGLVLDTDHPWVGKYRQAVKRQDAATLPVRVVSEPTFARIASAKITVTGTQKRFTGSTDRHGRLRVVGLPPGSYTISASKPNFTAVGGPARIDVLPGACGEAIVGLRSDSSLSGRVLDYLGRPVANTTGFDLLGWNTRRNRRSRRTSRKFETDENGEFHISGVLPGVYYLGANIWGDNHPKQCPLPQVLFPGSMTFKNAVPIFIDEGDEITDLTFRLPAFGPKRKLRLTVLDEQGEPVPDTLIENGAAAEDDRTMAAIEEKRTNREGIAEFEIWAVAEYRITARWVGNNTFRTSRVVFIPPDRDDISLTLRLR